MVLNKNKRKSRDDDEEPIDIEDSEEDKPKKKRNYNNRPKKCAARIKENIFPDSDSDPDIDFEDDLSSSDSSVCGGDSLLVPIRKKSSSRYYDISSSSSDSYSSSSSSSSDDDEGEKGEEIDPAVLKSGAYNLNELKFFCKQYRLKISGKKETLKDRLIKYLKEKNGENNVITLDDSSSDEKKKPPVKPQKITQGYLNGLPLYQLQALAEKHGVSFGLKTTRKDLTASILKSGSVDVKEQAKQGLKMLDEYHRGTVDYALSPSSIITIFRYAFDKVIVASQDDETFWFRWKLSLSTICKWAHKMMSSGGWFNSISLARYRPIQAYKSNIIELPLYKHFVNPFCLLKNIVKLDILDGDFISLFTARESAKIGYFIRDRTSTNVQQELTSNLEHLTIHESPLIGNLSYRDVPKIPSLRTFIYVKNGYSRQKNDLWRIEFLENVRHLELFDVSLSIEKCRNIESICWTPKNFSFSYSFFYCLMIRNQSELKKIGINMPTDMYLQNTHYLHDHSVCQSEEEIYANERVLNFIKDDIRESNLGITDSQIETKIREILKQLKVYGNSTTSPFKTWRSPIILLSLGGPFDPGRHLINTNYNSRDLFFELIKTPTVNHLVLGYINEEYAGAINQAHNIKTFEYLTLLKTNIGLKNLLLTLMDCVYLDNVIVYLDINYYDHFCKTNGGTDYLNIDVVDNNNNNKNVTIDSSSKDKKNVQPKNKRKSNTPQAGSFYVNSNLLEDFSFKIDTIYYEIRNHIFRDSVYKIILKKHQHVNSNT